MRAHVFSCLVAIAACGRDPDPKPTADLPSPAPAPAPAPAPPSEPVPDPGPRHVRATGTTAAQTAPAQRVRASRKALVADHLYVIADIVVPDDASFGWRAQHVEVLGAQPGAGALRASEEIRQVIVRLPTTTVPESLELVVETVDRDDEPVAPAHRAPVTLTDIAAAADDSTLPAAFFTALADDFRARGDAPFFAFAAGRADALASEQPANGPDPGGRDAPMPRSELGDLMRMYSGMTSIDEALQADRGLRIRAASSPASVPIADVAPIAAAPHPWDELLAKAPPPIIEPLAAYAPADFLYVHFASVASALALMDDVDALLAPLDALLAWRPGSNRFAERAQEALMLERGDLERLFGDLAVRSFAILLSDPFVGNGTDVSVIFHVKDRALFNGSLADYEKRAKARHPDLATTFMDGRAMTITRSANGDVSQYRVDAGDVTILSTSRGAMLRILAAAQKQAPALADAKDFRYFRSLYPYAPDAEDAFAFIGDAFVAAATSPRAKILQARRLAAAADLQAWDHAALFFGWLEGRPPRSQSELVASKIVSAAESKHADGSPILWTPDGGPESVWGRPRRMKPLVDSDTPERVTPEEAEAYARFRETYQSYWRSFIDPIGVRVRRDGSRVTLDARMMPLIEGSGYDDIVRMTGTARVVPGTVGAAGLQWTVALGDDAEVRRDLDRLVSFSGDGKLGFRWLGSYARVFVADRGSVLDALGAEGATLELRTAADEPRRRHALGGFAALPLVLGAHVADKLALGGALTALRAMADNAAPGLVDWRRGPDYRGVPTSIITATKEADELAGIAIHYATAHDELLVSLDEAALHEAIDHVLDGHGPSLGTAQQDSAQAHVGFRLTGRGALDQAALALLETIAYRQLRVALADLEALDRSLAGLPLAAPQRDALALRYLGYVPEPALGPIEACAVRTACRFRQPAYGSLAEPAVPAAVPEGSRLRAIVKAFASLDASLTFDGAGAARGLHVRIAWDRKRPN